MAHLLANNPGQQDAGEILLSGFTHMAFQMEAQRRQLTRPPGSSKPRRGKRGPKKQPQRGLGVAQLEKIRLEEQRRASQQAQQLAALRQLHASPPFLNSLNSAAMQAPACIIPQLDRENSHAHASHPSPAPPMKSFLPQFPCIEAISSSFSTGNASLGLRSALYPAARSSPLELFPIQKLEMTSLIKEADTGFSDKNWPPLQPQRSPNAAYDQTDDANDHGRLSYSLFHRRQNCLQIDELRHCSTVGQVQNRNMASPLCSLDRIMELTSFQSTVVPSKGEQPVFTKMKACGGTAQQQGNLLSDHPMWTIPSLAHGKPTIDQEVHYRQTGEDCELRLRPPGRQGSHAILKEEQAASGSQGRGPQNFLSLSVGSTWEDSAADAASSTPSPASATTASTASLQEEYTSPLVPRMPKTNNLSFTNMCLYSESQSLVSIVNDNVDLTLKL